MRMHGTTWKFLFLGRTETSRVHCLAFMIWQEQAELQAQLDEEEMGERTGGRRPRVPWEWSRLLLRDVLQNLAADRICASNAFCHLHIAFLQDLRENEQLLQEAGDLSYKIPEPLGRIGRRRTDSKAFGGPTQSRMSADHARKAKQSDCTWRCGHLWVYFIIYIYTYHLPWIVFGLSRFGFRGFVYYGILTVWLLYM